MLYCVSPTTGGSTLSVVDSSNGKAGELVLVPVVEHSMVRQSAELTRRAELLYSAELCSARRRTAGTGLAPSKQQAPSTVNPTATVVEDDVISWASSSTEVQVNRPEDLGTAGGVSWSSSPS